MYDIQQVRDLPIEGVAERLGLKVTKHKSLCPFHQDAHPSLSFRTSTNSFKCFVCGAHGGVIDLAMHVLGKSFVETCKWLVNEHNMILSDTKTKGSTSSPTKKPFDASRYLKFFEHPYINETARRFLYEERRLDPRIIRWCRLTSWTDKDGISWLQIPYFNQDWNLIGVQWRNLNPPHKGGAGGGPPRFRFPQGSQCHVYNLPVLKMLRPREPVYITEGCSDCWAMLSAGHKAIAIPSATLLKPEDLEPLRGRELHIFPDQDKAGEQLYKQLVSVATSLGCCLIRHKLPTGCKDFAEFYRQQYSNSSNQS